MDQQLQSSTKLQRVETGPEEFTRAPIITQEKALHSMIQEGHCLEKKGEELTKGHIDEKIMVTALLIQNKRIEQWQLIKP